MAPAGEAMSSWKLSSMSSVSCEPSLACRYAGFAALLRGALGAIKLCAVVVSASVGRGVSIACAWASAMGCGCGGGGGTGAVVAAAGVTCAAVEFTW